MNDSDTVEMIHEDALPGHESALEPKPEWQPRYPGSGRLEAQEYPAVSPGRATLVSGIATMVPVVAGTLLVRAHPPASGGTGGILLLAAGLVLGPSAGYIAADRTGRGLVGIGVRALALGGVVAGFVDSFSGASDRPTIVMLTSTGALVAAAAWDVARVGCGRSDADGGRDAGGVHVGRRIGVAPTVDAQGRVGVAVVIR